MPLRRLLPMLIVLALPAASAASTPAPATSQPASSGDPDAPPDSAVTSVVVDRVVTGRELVVEPPGGGAAFTVRMPDITVPEGVIDGAPVCGAEEARLTLQKLAPLGSYLQVTVRPRDHGVSLVPGSPGLWDRQLAADGAFYADPATNDGPLEMQLVKLGWATMGVQYDDAVRDPSEVGLSSDGLALFTEAYYEIRAAATARGVYRRCGGDARGAGPAVPVRSAWSVSRSGRVRSVAGAPVRVGMLMSGFAALGPGQARIIRGACAMWWPALGLTVQAENTDAAGNDVPPPATPDGCASRRVAYVSQTGRAATIGPLPPQPTYRALHRLIRESYYSADTHTFESWGNTKTGLGALGGVGSGRAQRIVEWNTQLGGPYVTNG